MQPSRGDLTKGGVVIAPDPSRAKHDIEIPWLVRGESARSQVPMSLETSALSNLFHDSESMYLGQFDASIDIDGREVASDRRKTIHQGLPKEAIVSDIVEKIGKYTGIHDADQSISRIVLEYLERRCFGQPMVLNERPETVDLLRRGLSDYIARYLSREFVQDKYNPKCVTVALSATNPFTWMHDIPLIEASKTIFNYVATLNQYERNFAKFLDRCEDVSSFTSLGVRKRDSLVRKGQQGLSSPSILSCDPDWIVVHYYNGEVWNWIITTKDHAPQNAPRNEFMITEWCEIATDFTGTCWQYLSVDPRIGFKRFPLFQSLIVDDVCRSLAALRATQKTPTSIEEILEMRDEGRL